MRPEAQAAVVLWHAVTFVRNVGVAVGTTSLETYLQGGPIAWATERQIELVGEALNNLRRVAPERNERIPDVHKIIATRNVLVHGYTEVNSTIVWQAATQAIPRLLPTLEALRAERLTQHAGACPLPGTLVEEDWLSPPQQAKTTEGSAAADGPEAIRDPSRCTCAAPAVCT